ncbi:MAG: hypothetical protein NUV63_12240 [Gallionella sp.]|nr:hypothetical protein [Gallionella sp.]
MSKRKRQQVKCDCGTRFDPRYPGQELCQQCLDAVEHDANVTMFGDDADYLEHAGLADEIGNQ